MEPCTRTNESRIVKAALKGYGINARVKRGRGTTFGYLYVTLPLGCNRSVVSGLIQAATGRTQSGMECVCFLSEQL
jgi:hypothetical protein